MKRRDLERALEAVPDFPQPDPDREQYRTPAPVAADLLWTAWTDGAIAGKDVLDLGCGTGIFALGAGLLGAQRVVGVDVGADAVAVARDGVPDATFITSDINDLDLQAAGAPFDTVVMNPPFGAQRANRGGDRPFYDKAAAAVRNAPSGTGTVWFLAQTKTERFLEAYARDLGMAIERIGTWAYPLPARFAFHGKAVAQIEVGGYRMAFG